MRNVISIITLIITLGSPIVGLAKDYPNIVVSIKPFYNLCAAVMESVGEPVLIVKNNASPHDYHLKPSDIELINKAELVIWGGDSIDGYLRKAIRNLAAGRVLDLAAVQGVQLLPLRTEVAWHVHEDGHHHHHGSYDGHYWLDPENARVLAWAIALRLSEIDPEHATVYQRNAQSFAQDLERRVVSWRAELGVMQGVPYLVFHDAYQYFNRYFGLHGVGAISVNPEIPPSAQRIAQVQQLIRDEQVVCVFSEPQFSYKIVDSLANGSSVYRGVLDPIGRDEDLGAQGYVHLLANMVRSFGACGEQVR